MAAYHVGFSTRKARILSQFLGETVSRLPAKGLPDTEDRIYAWGDVAVPPGAATIIRVEDGFLRSVGLGAAFAEPVSWVFDEGGLHHQADRATRLERLILEIPDDPALLERAQALAARVRSSGLTKYNLPHDASDFRVARDPEGQCQRQHLLVIGQVAGDAALRSIMTPVRSNMELLRAVRANNPTACIVYKRHPDVVRGLRDGDDRQASDYADHITDHAEVDTVLAWADEVHVLNSLFGFEALIRGARVVCHATPFYAGWGLTKDLCATPRRGVERSLAQLLAAALLLYPRYRDPRRGVACPPEVALDILVDARTRRETGGAVGILDAFKVQLGRLARRLGLTDRAGA